VFISISCELGENIFTSPSGEEPILVQTGRKGENIMTLKAVNPATGETIREYPEMEREELSEIIESAHQAFLEWKDTDFSIRSRLMKRAAEILRERKEEYGKLMALEMGKPISEGAAECEKCALVCDFYADNAEEFLKPEMIATEAAKSYVTFQPMGVILAVMPWNFPFWQVFRFIAPGLMAGNAGVLKHASNVPGSALAIEEVIRDAGFPDNIFRTLLIGSRKVEAVIENPHIKAVTLTGSTPAGSAVAGKAASLIKKAVLELGGSDPSVILEDVDIEGTVMSCVTSRLINGGQSCIAAKRFIVVESVRERFTELLVEKMGAQVMGDPLDGRTTLGPMAREDLRDELHDQVIRSVEMGAQVLLGGRKPEAEEGGIGKGAYYPPTVLVDVKKGMAAYGEEIFGPVAAIIGVKDEEEAIQVANDSIFGLGAAVYTGDAERGERIARERLEAGSCFVNSFVKSDPRLPFGGIKESGFGRELSHYGIKEFMNIKTIYVR